MAKTTKISLNTDNPRILETAAKQMAKEIPDGNISLLAGFRFLCGCGREHGSDVNKIVIGPETRDEILKTAEDYRSETILIVSDNNTWEVMGRNVEGFLKSAGFRVKSLVFRSEHPLVPNETAVGRLLMAVEKDTGLIMAAGSGTLNDLSRLVSFRTGVPYCIIATAPSMDGYASTVSPLIVEGFKTTFEAASPVAIIADPACLSKAPAPMISAGFGDIMGKYTALTDWALANRINGEYYCEAIAGLMNKAVSKCAEHAADIANRDEKGIGILMEALILSGVAMGFSGNSRPASGAEHHLAHFWEMDALRNKKEHDLHGNMVGVGALVVSRIYETVDQKQELGLDLPDKNGIERLLKIVGAPTDPKTLGVSKDLFYHSIIHAKEIRPRYTILHLAEKLGLLEKAAREITEYYYGDIQLQ